MVLDATLAGASANSYLTVAEADAEALVELGKNAKAWNEATVEQREAALIQATEDIDYTVGRVSATYSPAQRLLFPRVTDLIVGTSTPELPRRIKSATFLQAAHLLRNADLMDDAASFRARGLSSFSNPDGTGGTLSDDPRAGRLHPRVDVLLDEFSAGSVVGTIVTARTAGGGEGVPHPVGESNAPWRGPMSTGSQAAGGGRGDERGRVVPRPC